MSYIIPGKCRQCGCSGYKDPIEGDNCYTCGHVCDLHLLEYKPNTQSRDRVRAPETSSMSLLEATVDLPMTKALTEEYPEGAPEICFEETVAVGPTSSKSGPSRGHHQTSLEPVYMSPKTSQISNTGGLSQKQLTPASPATPVKTSFQRSGLLWDSPKTNVKQSPGKVTPKKKRTADIFESPSQYNGQKPACWRLMMSHLPYGMVPPEGIKGPYKIAEKGKTIYVGNATKVPIGQTLRKKFMGKDKQCIGAYLSTLTEDQREKDITIFWIDESETDHTCKCTFLKCFERMEGKKPKLNMAGVR